MDSTASQGLSTAEASERLVEFGENTIARRRRLQPVVLFLNKLNSPLSLILIGASIVSYFLGEGSNALIILLMVLVSAILDFVNTYHSEKAVEALEAKVATTVKVRRDGREVELPTNLIVPGDVVILEAGDLIPADGVILEAKDVYANESALTGESFPVEKQAAASVNADELASVTNAHDLMMGTSIVSGFATLQVVETGRRTAFGRLASRLQNPPGESDFERGIKNFSYFTIRITILLVIFVFGANSLFGRGILESFLFAVAIAIGLTPELLPVILSVSLARGSVRMAAKDVVVRRLSAIENLGSMTVLCTDKTGTLTENRIVLVRWIDGRGRESDHVLRLATIASHFHSGVANPLDEAVVHHGQAHLEGIKKIDEVPFDFDRRRSSVVVSDGQALTLVARGAPEDIFAAVGFIRAEGKTRPFSNADQKSATAEFVALSEDGYRVLAIASKKVAKKAHYEKADEKDLVFEGFVAFLDPPKAGVGAALKELEAIGINVKIITGDHEVLARKICREVGLRVDGVLTGKEVTELNDAELMTRLDATTIFARIEPEQKERLVLCFKKAGAVVGFLGDGINDAPALKAADVGMSVNNAVSVAKDSADIILLKKSLLVLKDGVVEGRKTFQNTMKYILMGLSSNFGNVFSMAGASIFLPFLPMLPPQILLNNFLYDMSQLSLSTDHVDAEATARPLHWDFRLIRRYMLVFGVVSSVFDFVTFFVLIRVFHLHQSGFQTSWFIESLTTQAVVIFLIRTRKLPFIQSRPSGWLLGNVALAVAVAWLIPFSPLARYFHFGPVSASILWSVAIIV